MKAYLLEVFIEHQLQQLNRPFTYVYHGPIIPQKGIRVRVPFRQQSLIGYVTESKLIEDFKTYQASSPYPILEVTELLDEKPILSIELLTLVDELATQQFSSKIGLLQAMLPPSLFPSKQSLRGPKVAYEDWLVFIKEPDVTLLNAHQRNWWALVKGFNKVRTHEIKSKAAIKFFVEEGFARLEKIEKRRFDFKPIKVDTKPTLSIDQQQVLKEIHQSSQKIFLLEGVTGSGKTEVYLTLSEQVIKQNQTVLMIVPEIALTPVMMSYYHQRFGEKVAILHSGLTPAEKFDEYRRILRGEVLVVVGARSAIFAPLEKIGLIVLDEEHSETYKQDTPPYYHAREIALWRRQFHQCLLVMGTATPSLESRARAQKGIYQHLMLSKRIFDQSLPTTHIVDMNQTQYLSNQDSIFSQRLLDGIKKRLSTKEQVILLINRRGFAQSIVCRQCEYRFICPSCQVPLAYHAQINSLKCHYCDHLETLPTQCPSCQGHQLMKEGFGTEKVVSSLQRLFPEANIARLDTDMTGVRSNVTNILKQFQEKKIDILVGTQMVAKGHDFPNVTLVGVMLADLGLHVPHYRATERTFQLIAQVVGRTGRGTQPGEAIIQTTMPNHHAIQLGAKQDYPSFYEREMKDRKLRQYPPFTFLARFELTSRDQNLVDEVALELEQSLKTQLENVAEVIGPNIPYPEFYAGVYRRRILLKYKKYQLLHPILETIYPLLLTKKTVKILFNLDPYDM